jgi:hypothetical protein
LIPTAPLSSLSAATASVLPSLLMAIVHPNSSLDWVLDALKY